jgi:transposase
MPQERLSMRKIAEILRLKWSCGLSDRAIARSCGICHGTVAEFVTRARLAGLSWPLPEELDEDALYRRLYPPVSHPGQQAIPLPDWAHVHSELRRKGVTLRLLWVEYREAHPDGYGYSQFCNLYRQWAKRLNPSLRLAHAAGEKLFVDYAGQTVPVIDPQTGEVRQAQLFVAVLGASNYTYAEAQWSQELPHWIAGHVRLFAFLGGVPHILVPDNLKAGVKRACRYEPDLNPTYQALAEHYDTAIIPTRVRKPKDKAKVEVAVQVVERWILARLRNHPFFGLAELNHAIQQLLQALNDRPMRHLGQSRRQLFESLDQPALKPLPARPYELAIWKKARVNVDYHIEFEGHYYSVPYALIRQPVEVRASERSVEVFHKRQRVACHPRSSTRGQHTTLAEHMPSSHRVMVEWSAERLLYWAQSIGPHTVQLVETMLATRKHPEQAYRSCLGVLRLATRFGQPRLEAACRRALHAGLHSYRGVKNILDAQLDRLLEPDASLDVNAPPHANIRGQSYYR